MVVVAHYRRERNLALNNGCNETLELPFERLHADVVARRRAYVAHINREIGLERVERGLVEFQRVRALRSAFFRADIIVLVRVAEEQDFELSVLIESELLVVHLSAPYLKTASLIASLTVGWGNAVFLISSTVILFASIAAAPYISSDALPPAM